MASQARAIVFAVAVAVCAVVPHRVAVSCQQAADHLSQAAETNGRVVVAP